MLGSAFAAVLTACRSVGSDVQQELPNAPWSFIDAPTQRVVDEVLIVPRYSSHTGVSTSGGHGPGFASERVFVASPFIYKAGERLSPSVPRSGGVMSGPFQAFAGKAITLDGVLVVAPGYKPQWIWDLWSKADDTRRTDLQPLRPREAAAALRRIAELLRKPVLTGGDVRPWSLGAGGRLEVRLEPEERDRADSWLQFRAAEFSSSTE
jgi:hypothetical protein